MNVADTERASSRLREAGFSLTSAIQASDVVIFNTCSVRARAVQKVFTRIGEVRNSKHGRDIVIGVMGCVAQLEGEALFDRSFKIDLIAGPQAIDRLPLLVEMALKGKQKTLDLGERGIDENWEVLMSERHSPFVAFVPIIEGCNKFCSYCIVPFSRGREKSRIAIEIVEEVARLRREGFFEVHLIGQNVNSYRPKTNRGLEAFPGATPFSRLLRAVASTGMKRIKFTTSFPRDFHPDIVTAMEENKNLCDWVHLPVQSGSDRILSAMRRGYKRDDYFRKVDVIKHANRRFALTSDIIVGFPGETQNDFDETMSLVECCQYDSIYIFKYSERSGTSAFGLVDNISIQEKTSRFLALEALQRNIQNRINESYIGREIRVLVERASTKSQHDMAGHSTCHKVVNFPGDISLLGQEVLVSVTAAKMNSLYGQINTKRPLS